MSDPISHDTAFDPFDDVDDDNNDMEHVVGDSFFPNQQNAKSMTSTNPFDTDSFGVDGAHQSFDSTFNSSGFNFGAEVMVSPSSNGSFDDSGGTARFGSPGTPASAISSDVDDGFDHEHELFFPTSGKRAIPINVALHEEMSCVYDGVSKTSSLCIEGIVSVNSSADLDGKNFHLKLNDREQHLDKLVFDASFVSEINVTAEKGGSNRRIFSAVLPEGLPPDGDIQMVKYTCANTLCPYPVLVQSKVRTAGNLCRVAVKVRSNPTNEKAFQNMVILLAIPPDLNGESVAMSKEGAMWDAMKRLIVWNYKEIKPGDTVEFQAQFEFNTKQGKGLRSSVEPKFPTLVRFDSMESQLSSVDLQVNKSAEGEDVSDNEEFKLNLKRSYRVLHRKV